MSFEPTIVAGLAVAAFIAGVVDAIGGGGGLISVPLLLAAGLGPHAALATNKGQACLGAASSLITYVRSKGVDRDRIWLGLGTGFAGSLLGSRLLLAIPAKPLSPVVLGLLVFAGVALILRERLMKPLAAPRASPARLAGLGFSIGAYDGFFGPGTGTLLIIGFRHFFGDGLTRASGNAKIVNFGSNLAAFLVFQWNSAILWKLALPMGIANVVGAALGARLALRHGDRVVRVVVLVVLSVVLLKVGSDWLR